MDKKLTVLCVPLSALGHMNASLGIALALKRKGHHIVFVLEKSWKGHFLKYGFDEELYEEQDDNGVSPDEFWADLMNGFNKNMEGPTDEQVIIMQTCLSLFVEAVKYSDERIKQIIEDVKPDIILQDNYVAYPAMKMSNLPIVEIFSANPLNCLDFDTLPPDGFGLPLHDSSDWKRCRELKRKAHEKQQQEFSEWMVSKGAPPLPSGSYHYEYDLHVMIYPKSLFKEYGERVNLGTNWMLVDHVVRERMETLELPEDFKNKPGKIIYLSLGSLGSSFTAVMNRLLRILSKSNYKVIVCTGGRHEDIELRDNMWGQPMVPQLAVLSICDLFVTHAGNNSFTEALYFGKPMVAIPLFSDQHNNAQRLQEMNLGLKMNPYTVSEEELLSGIDSILGDRELHRKLKAISKEMQESTSIDDVVQRIVQIANRNTN